MGQGVNWEALDRQRANNGMGEKIISAVLQMGMNQKASQQDAEIKKQLQVEQGKIELQNAIELAKAKSQYDPDMMMIDKLTGAGNQPAGGVLGQGSEVSQPGFNLDNNQLLRGIVSKKFGVPYNEFATPEEKLSKQQEELDLATGKAKITEEFRPPSQLEQTNSLFTKRLEQAEKVFSDMEGELSSLGAGAAIQGKLPNLLKSSFTQSYEQAKRNFLNSVLRKESGAVISATEFKEGDLQYFPQPFDKPAVIAQKKENRRVAIEGLRQASGKAYKEEAGAFKGVGTTPNINQDFKSEDEALASGIKGIVIINGRKARID